MLRILKRQKRLSISKASDLTGFDAARCQSALENLCEKKFVTLEADQYWVTAEGQGYLAYSKSFKDPSSRLIKS
jgi:hypothetical protein